MRDTSSPNLTAHRTVPADPQQPTNDLRCTESRFAQLSIVSITRISEEQARQLVDSQLTAYGKAGSRYLGSDYYELRPSKPQNSISAGTSFLRLPEQMMQAHDDIAGASISPNGSLSDRRGGHLGTAYSTTKGTIVLQIPRWQQED